MNFSLPNLAMSRPISVIMLMVTLIGLGVIAYTRIPLEFIPRLDIPFIACVIPYPGSTPEQVENEIAIPAEGEFRTIPNLQRIMTVSDSNGCMVRIFFDWDADMAVASGEVRDRMERLKLKLPAGVDRFYLQRFSDTSLPIMMLSISWDGDEEELAHIARMILRPRIMRVEGVADVQIFGKPEREVLIEFDQEALRARNISLYEIVGQLQSSNVNLGAGKFEDGQTEYFVRTMNEFTRPEEYANLIIGANGLRLKDVADVGYRAREIEEDYSMDGRRGAFMMVFKESEANAVSTCLGVRAQLDTLATDPTFRGTEYFMFFDQSEAIVGALDGLTSAGKYGGLMAVCVLFLFLRRVRPTLLVALAIPSSIVAGLVFMFFAEMSLNIVTMVSLIIALGMVVDNSIVVIENIYRYNQLGLDPVESARRGASEVGLAITASTLTTAVVFVPVLYVQAGEMATYMKHFALPVSMALFASLLIALTVIPLAASKMPELNPDNVSSGRKRLGGLLNRLLGAERVKRATNLRKRIRPIAATMTFYGACLSWVMRWRMVSTLLILAFLVVTALIPGKNIERSGTPEVDTRQVEIALTFDQNFDLDLIQETMQQIREKIDMQREELGIANVFTTSNPRRGGINVYLRPIEEMEDEGIEQIFSTEEVRDILWQRLPATVPGAELNFQVAEAGEESERGISIMMRGDDIGQLREFAQRFASLMENVRNISNVKTDVDRMAQEIQVKIDDVLARQSGISPFVIAQSVDFALRGIQLPYLKQGGREIAVWAQFREEDRKSRSNLENVSMLTPMDGLVEINRMVDLTKAFSNPSIRRVNGKNVVSISAQVSTLGFTDAIEGMKDLIASYGLPPGYTIDLGDEIAELDMDFANFTTAMLLAIVLIYLVMGALFESYLLPISILTTVPLAGIGALWAMYLTRTPLDVICFIGLILMVGIIVNNGIVIIDHINQLRAGGMERLPAILQAGQDRFRPVMMTALTTILGCVPLAIGGGAGKAVSLSGLGRALIGGLVVGTFLTLLIVPLFYTFIDDIRVWMLRYFADLASLVRRKDKSTQSAKE